MVVIFSKALMTRSQYFQIKETGSRFSILLSTFCLLFALIFSNAVIAKSEKIDQAKNDQIQASQAQVSQEVLTSIAAPTPTPTPNTLVEDFHQQLLMTMQQGDNFQQRYAMLAPIVAKSFDMKTIARVSLGKTWRSLSEQQRTDFKKLMQEVIVSTYSDRFDGYNDQRFVTRDSRDKGNGRWVIKTDLLKSNGQAVHLDYYFRNGLIFNVVANGVSDLSLRRSDYAAILKEKDFNGLIADIRSSLQRYYHEG